MKLKWLVLAVVAASVTGCGLSPEYREAREAKRIAEYKSTCTRMGYAEGTAEQRYCAVKLYQAEMGKLSTSSQGVAPIKQTRCVTIGNSLSCQSY